MAVAETAQVAVRLSLDDRLSPAIKKISDRLGAFSGAINRNLARAVDAAASFAARKLVGAFEGGIAALKEDAVVSAQTAAVIKSTGGAAGVTAEAVAQLADKLSMLDGVQDNVVQGAENVILRFTHIGSDIFPAVTQAALDMAAATGGDAASAALKLSRALDDPLQSLGALTRLGITFSKQEKAQIADLIKHNDLRSAQAIILGRVATKYGDVARQQAEADPSRKLAVAEERFQKALASGLLPVVTKIQERLADWLIKPSTIATVRQIGDAIGALFSDQNLDAIASGLERAAGAVSGAINLFNQLPPEIKALAIGAFAINKVTGGAVTGAAAAFGKLIGAGLQKIFAANVTVITPNAISGAGDLVGGATKGGGLVGTLTAVLGSTAFAAVAGSLLVAGTALVINEIEKDKDLRITSGGTDASGRPRAFGRFGAVGQVASGTGVTDSIAAQKVFSGIGYRFTDAIHMLGANLADKIGQLADSARSISQFSGYLKKLDSRTKDLRAERRADLKSGDTYGAKLISIRLAAIARREEITKRAVDALRTSTNPKLTAISTRIDLEKNRLSSLQQRLHVAKEHHDTALAARLRERIQNVQNKIAVSNQKLQAIVNKPWHLTIPINNQISIADYANASGYHRTVAHQSSLTTKVIR